MHRCPAHEDRTPSLRVTRGRDGRALIHCFGCGDTISILDALGLTEAELYGKRGARRRRGPTEDVRIFMAGGVQWARIGDKLQRSTPGLAFPDDPEERAVLAALHLFAFRLPLCCPSQETLAELLDMSRCKVNRICARLKKAGLISWTRHRYGGSRWEHNRYVLHTSWHRPHRASILNWLRARQGDCTLREQQDVKQRCVDQIRSLMEAPNAPPDDRVVAVSDRVSEVEEGLEWLGSKFGVVPV